MRTKKYIGKTAHEAMLKLKMELGPDAIVLSTKNVRSKGFFGFFKKPLVEIIAAFEDKDIVQRNSTTNDIKFKEINEELAQIKNIMLNLSTNIAKEDDLPNSLDEIHRIMVNNGVNISISTNILKDIEKNINLDNKDIDALKRIVKFNLAEVLGEPVPISIPENNQKIIFFVGSTGVGKTTTLAKLAANFVMENKYKIGLITSDTYRIAAVEQLRVYSEILQLPLEVAFDETDILKSIEKFKDKDIILIDTAGRSHNDSKQLIELEKIINIVEDKEVYLLLDATIDQKVITKVLKNYSFLDDYKVIVTKVDEAGNFGNLINIKYLSNKDLSYYTFGQDVPDDIKLIDTEEVLEKIIEESTDD